MKRLKVRTLRIEKRKADELRLKGAVAELKGFIRAVERGKRYVVVKDRETHIDQAIYRPAYETVVAMLPRVRDEELIREAVRMQKKSSEDEFLCFSVTFACLYMDCLMLLEM